MLRVVFRGLDLGLFFRRIVFVSCSPARFQLIVLDQVNWVAVPETFYRITVPPAYLVAQRQHPPETRCIRCSFYVLSIDSIPQALFLRFSILRPLCLLRVFRERPKSYSFPGDHSARFSPLVSLLSMLVVFIMCNPQLTLLAR